VEEGKTMLGFSRQRRHENYHYMDVSVFQMMTAGNMPGGFVALFL
jgi:hypothetical protein